MTDSNSIGNDVNSGLVVAADLGGTHLRVAAVDHTGQIHFRFKQNTPHATSAGDIARAIILAARQCESETLGTGSVRAIAVAVPGTVDAPKGLVVRTPNVPCLDGFSLGAAIESELKYPVILENDANAAAMGEMWLGAARDSSAIICVTLGTGVGGGVILDGKLWRGANGSAGEIGHMSLDPFAGAPCPCGGRGCLEVYTSATAIVRMTREELPSYPDSSLKPDDKLTSEKIYRAGVAGDELALEIFRRMGVYLGIGLANLVNILNPEIIVIGGGVVNGWDLFQQHMHQKVMERAFPSPVTGVKIVPAECGDDAGLLGAARLALEVEATALL